jgi:hypothetical protein
MYGPPLKAAKSARWCRVVWWVSLAWLATLVLVGVSDGRLIDGFFDSDHLYIPTLVEDLTRWHGDLRSWHLTPAPYFIPDIPLYAGLRLFGLEIEWAQYLSGILHLWLVAWSARAVVETTLSESARVARSANVVGPVFVLALVLHLQGELGLMGALFVLSNHGGAAWGALSMFALLLHAPTRPSRRWWSAVAVFGFVMACADPLFAASCGAPLGIIALASVVSRARGRAGALARTPTGLYFCASGASLLGAQADQLLQFALSGLKVRPAPNPELRAASLAQLFADLCGPARPEFILITSALLLAGWTLWHFRGRTNHSKLRALALFHWVSSACTLGAIAWAGNYMDLATLRYLLVPFTTSLVLFAALLAAAVARAPALTGFQLPKLAAACVSVGLIATLFSQRASLAEGQYVPKLRENAQCVDDAAIMYGSDTVIADYWSAKPLMLFGRGRVKVLQLEPKLDKPFWWINSKNWYRGQHVFGMIATNGLDTHSIRETFGAPQLVTDCGRIELYVYSGQSRQHLQDALQRSIDRFIGARL